MAKRILVDATYPQETRVVLLNDSNQIEELEYETFNKQQIKGNIYLAKIVRIEPSLQAAFIEYGNDKNGFLSFSEIHPVYYHIPTSDRDKISAELESISRPEITQKDIADSNKNRLSEDADSGLLSLDGEIEEGSEEEPEAEEAGENKKPSRNNLYNQYKIQDVIKKGQIILVQADKEARGNKGASFTSYISLAGKYCVLMPNSGGHNGISRKIASSEERRRLRSIIDDLVSAEDSEKASLIIRTAGIRKSTYDIKRDYDYLVRLWNKIREVTLTSTAPAFIHMEDDIIKKTIRDICDHNVKEVLIQGEYAKACASEIMHNMLPSDVHKIVEYTAKTPIFSKFGVEEQLSNLYQPVSPLSSGGYVVINPTEALISIDVNSGKATSERGIEETAVRTNIEAAKEIARQLKLRDLSGLVVVDFIDMYESRNRKLVERTFKEALSKDRARIQVGHISSFGLLEMSRQRLRSSFLESNTKMCGHCNGKGIVRADESNAMLILRTIEQEIFKSEVNIVNVYAHLNSVMYLLNHKRHEVKLIEEKHNIILNFLHDHEATSDSFSIEKIRGNDAAKNKKQSEPKPALALSTSLFETDSAMPVNNSNNNSNKPASTKSRRSKKWKDKLQDKPMDQDKEMDNAASVESEVTAPATAHIAESPSEPANIASEGNDTPKAEKSKKRRPKKYPKKPVSSEAGEKTEEAVSEAVKEKVEVAKAHKHVKAEVPAAAPEKQALSEPDTAATQKPNTKPARRRKTAAPKNVEKPVEAS